MITRRSLFRSLSAIAAASAARAEPTRQFRIGYQKNGILPARQQQAIDNRLRSLGVSVSWTEFSGPLVGALRLGSLDFGTVGDICRSLPSSTRRLTLCRGGTVRSSKSAGLLPARRCKLWRI
jgi:ABC-type nitrate/sulfonate/bicarbonate transport system substrate-binding protein